MDELDYLLCIDTAQAGCGVAVVCHDGTLKASQSEPMVRGQSERLIPQIQEALETAGLGFADLNGIAVNVGPGAFTGLRIGVSAARSLGLALEIPVYGVSSFEGYARMYLAQKNKCDKEGQHPFAVLLETKRQDFYVQVFNAGGDSVSERSALNAQGALALLQEHKVQSVIGDALDRFCVQNEQTFPTEDYDMLHAQMALPEYYGFALQEQRANGDILGQPEPIYMRPADVSQTKKTYRRLKS